MAAFGQTFQHLGGPDHGNVGRFAHPQDFLLQLGHALEAALHGEIPPRNHHAAGREFHRLQQYTGEIGESLLGLDLDHHANIVTAQFMQALAQITHIARGIGERQAD